MGSPLRRLHFVVAVVLTISAANAQTMPTITTTNNNDAWLEVIPIDLAHQGVLPSAVHGLSSELPPGAFLLRNKTATAVTVIVAKWIFTDSSGASQERRIYCDAYLTTHIDPLINGNDSALITPDGSVREEYVGRLKTQNFLGSPLGSPHNTELLKATDRIAGVKISIDSVIFADGQIWGPDNLQYYKTLMKRQLIRQSVADEVIAAQNAGEEVLTRLNKIQNEAGSNKDKTSAERGYYARLIQKSPNPEGTLHWLQQNPLPDFHHIGE